MEILISFEFRDHMNILSIKKNTLILKYAW